MKKTIVMRLIKSYVEKDTPFIIILHGGNQSQPLRFLEEDSECLIVESILDGILAAYDYEDIANLSPVSTTPSSRSCDTNEETLVNNSLGTKTEESDFSKYWYQEYEKAENIINCEKVTMIDRRDTVKAQVKHTEIAKDWGRVDSMFNDAKKNHSLKQKADKIIAELDSLPQCTEVKVSLGMVFAALNEFDTASEEFYNGGDYHNAAYCALQIGDEKTAFKYLKCLIKSEKSYESNMLSAFFSLAVKYKDITFDVDSFRSPNSSYVETVFYGLLMLYKIYNNDFAGLGKASNDYLSNISVIINKLGNIKPSKQEPDVELTSFKSISEYNNNLNEQASEESENEIVGEIYSFFKYGNNAYGYITTKDNKQLYFNVRQVEDEQLRNLLWNVDAKGISVSLTLGIGQNGKKAADHIKLAEKVSEEELSTRKTVCDGMLCSYNNYDQKGNRYGVITYNNKDVLFRDEAVIDPILKSYFQDTFSIKNIYVKFIGIKVAGNHIAQKVWLDTNEEAEQKIFDEYYAHVSKDAYDKFVENKNIIENETNMPCPFGYVSLPGWVYDEKTKYFNKAQSYEEKNRFLTSKVENDESYLGIYELLANGTHYLTIVKDLEKAESSFLAVLDRNPERTHINTAVSNLVTIYQQENRIDDALNILQKYCDKIEREKYNNQLIQIYDKSKRYENLIKVLNDVIPNAGKAKSHRIKQLITCYLKTNNGTEAIKLLKEHKKSIDELSYNNLYSSALEIAGDISGLENFLKKTVESTYRVEHKLNYMNRLALLYQKTRNTRDAIDAYERWKKYYSLNKSGLTMSTSISAAAKLEVVVDRNLCILYYSSNRIEDAIPIAKNLLRKNSEDVIAQQILDGTYQPLDGTVQTNPEEMYGYDDLEAVDNNIPKLLEWMMNNIDYGKYLYNMSILKNIKDARYIADENQAKTDIEDSLNTIRNRNHADIGMGYLAIAKIAKQIVDGGRVNEYFTQAKVNLFLGKGLLLQADTTILDGHQNRETSRYYYFLSLRYLSRISKTSSEINRFYHAVNILYRSFFLSDNELRKAFSPNSFDDDLCLTPPNYQNSVVAPKELMICTFDLDTIYHRSQIGDDQVVRKIVNSVFEDANLREYFSTCMSNIGIAVDEAKNSDEYFKLWRRAKDKYNKSLKELLGNINNASKSTHEPEKLNNYLNSIYASNPEHILGKVDCEYLDGILGILKRFQKINELNVIDDLLTELDKEVESCDSLEKNIQGNPTDFSYEKLLETVIMLKNNAVKRINDLYSESKPDLRVSSDTTVFYKDEHNQATVTFYIENYGNVQKADVSNIVLVGENNNIKVVGNPEHTVTTVRGNQKEEYIVNISFTNEEKISKLFDVSFSFEYSYFDGNGDPFKDSFNEKFQINLSSMDSFSKIENKYSSFTDGGAVDSDEMFFGREKNITSIVDSLDQKDGRVLSHRGIYMYGQKRAGKSSIMSHLADRINTRYPNKYIIINLGSIGTAIDAMYETWLKTSIVNKLQDEFEDNFPDIYDKIENADGLSFDDVINKIEEQPTSNIFERFLEKIESFIPDKVIMIFIDEFTYIYESIKRSQCSETFPRFWKALLQNHNICSIIIGQDSMVNFASDFANDFACMKAFFVSYLDEDEAKKMIVDPIRDNGENRFDDDALDLIYKLTAGSAYLIMIICSQLVDYMNQRGTSRVTKTTIETFVRKWLMNASENSNPLNEMVFDPQLRDPCFFEDSDTVYNDNKIILTYISNHCNLNRQIKISDINCTHMLSKNDEEYKNKLIEQLIKRKVLIKENELCQIVVDLLREYLKTAG